MSKRNSIRHAWGGGTIASHQRARQSKIAYKSGWLTRKRGTPKQIGSKFPITSKQLERAARITGSSLHRADVYAQKVAEKIGYAAATKKRIKRSLQTRLRRKA